MTFSGIYIEIQFKTSEYIVAIVDFTIIILLTTLVILAIVWVCFIKGSFNLWFPLLLVNQQDKCSIRSFNVQRVLNIVSKWKHIQLTQHVHYCIQNIYHVQYATQWNFIIFNDLDHMTVESLTFHLFFLDSVLLNCLQTKNAWGDAIGPCA